jgi:hypothetical protein
VKSVNGTLRVLKALNVPFTANGNQTPAVVRIQERLEAMLA